MNVAFLARPGINKLAASRLGGLTRTRAPRNPSFGRRYHVARGPWHVLVASSTFRLLSTLAGAATKNDTIYALSTAPGRAAIAVIRISGPACLEIYKGLCPKKPLPKPRVATLRRLYSPGSVQEDQTVLDSSALVLYFPSPHTVTGEKILELHVHGGHAIVKAVLEAIPRCTSATDLPLRYADPGEFTRRAFYNGRLDLTQVEALGDVLSAETEQQRRLAVSGSDHGLGARYEEWRKMLLYARGELEALIDFSEDQHFDESPAEFMASVTAQILLLKRQVQLHITNASKGELLRSGINLALLGAPNAGKSSLLNRIAGREAAIVSSEAGTTRDVIDVGVDIAGWLCRLGDTAGLRNDVSAMFTSTGSSIGEIEKEGVRRAKARALASDVVIAVLSFEAESTEEKPTLRIDPEVVSAIAQCKEASKAILIVLNKIDKIERPSTASPGEILSYIANSSSKSLNAVFNDVPASNIIPISCQDAANPSRNTIDPGNIQHLLNALTTAFSSLTTPSIDGILSPHDPSYWEHSLSVSHRQSENLKQCLGHLNNFLETSGARSPTTSEPTTTEAKPASDYHTDAHEDIVPPNIISASQHLSPSLSSSIFDEVLETDMDIVAAAEHLRLAANCLAKITGKDEAGDVENVLGVVFEKFCVGK